MAMRAMLYASFYRGAGGWRTKRVLIVDDSKVMRRFLCRLMEREGFATDEAINGQSALELMQQRYYDVAFVDLEMPGMGGLECASALREWEKKIGRTQRQRICAVSSHSRAKEQKALNAGFDSYQNKPIRGKSLLKVVTSDSDSQRDKTPSPKGGSDEQPSGEASFGAPSDTPQQQ
jgi:CheY-like chemotaxis protein